MLPKSFHAVLIVAGLFAGCTVGPTYHRPDKPMPEALQDQKAVDQRHFGDPQMTRHVTLALEQNLDLSQAIARVTQSRASLGTADATFFPARPLSGQTTRCYQSIETQSTKTLSSTPDFDRYGNVYEANLSAGWELDVFGGLRRGQKAMLADYQASEAGVTAPRLAVAAQTADIYIRIRGLQSRLKIARQHTKTQRKLRATVMRLYEKGLATKIQISQR